MNFYKITFEMGAPICFIERPIFDALLAYCYMRDTAVDFEQKLNINKEELIDFFSVLPLAVKENDGLKYFNASWIFYDTKEVKQTQDSFKKRFDFYNDSIVDFDGKTEKITITKGEYKSYDMPISIYHIKKCWFFIETENIDEIKRLISTYLFGIGKKTAYGYGKIKTFHVEHLEYDPFKNDIIRPIPYKSKIKKSVFTSYKPPYWLYLNQTFCKIKK